jgi:hypothetical protein
MSEVVDLYTVKVDSLLALVAQVLTQHGDLSPEDAAKLEASGSKIDATITALQAAIAAPAPAPAPATAANGADAPPPAA